MTRDLYAAHDRRRFRVLGFSGRDRSGEPAPYAGIIRSGFEALHEIDPWRSTAAAARIATEGVDILVALDQHMDWQGATSSPEILALRPAPLQLVRKPASLPAPGCRHRSICWPDAVTVPPGEEALYAETVLCLPGLLSLRQPA